MYGGTASPNPDYPQEVVNVGTVKKNIINIESTDITTSAMSKSISNNELTLTGTGSTQGYIRFYIRNTKPNTTYTFSYSAIAENFGKCMIRDYNSNNQYTQVLSQESTNLNFSFTTASDNSYLLIFLYVSAGGTQTYSKIQLEEGLEKTSYVPYGYGSIDVKVSNKNLYNSSLTPEPYSYNGSGVKTSNSATCINQEIVNVDFSSIIVSFASKVGEGYIRICEYKEDGTFIKRTNVTATNTTLTLDTNTKKLIFSVNASSTIYFTDLMIREATTSSDYVVHEEQTVTLVLPTGMEMCKIGNYQDSFVKQNGTWYKFKVINKITSYNGETITTDYISSTGGLDTGATVYYVLNEPVLEEITDTNLIQQLDNTLNLYSYEGTTYINSDDVISPIFDVTYYKSLNLLFN